MILLILTILYAYASFDNLLSKYSIPLASINSTESIEVCIYTNRSVGPDILDLSRYNNMEFYNLDPKSWCYYGNGTYLIKLELSADLDLYVASQSTLNDFCVIHQNVTRCSNVSFSIGGYNFRKVQVPNYRGEVILVNNTNPNSYLFWYNLSSYQFLGFGCVAQSIPHNIPNLIPYDRDTRNDLFFIISNYTKSRLIYIKSSDNTSPISICNRMIILDRPSNELESDRVLIISDYIRNPGKKGLNVFPLNISYNLLNHDIYKPEIALESAANLRGRNVNSTDISLGIAGLASIYLMALKGFEHNTLVIPYLLLSAERCDVNYCVNLSLSRALQSNHWSFYSYRHTRTDISLETQVGGDYVVFNMHRNISTNASNSTNFKNLIIGYISPGNTTISIFWDHPIDGVVYFVYRNALFRSISTNRSLYKGYIDGVVIDIENNHPESYLYIEGISLEAWNASGKVADLLSKVIDLPINARGKISINLSFYIPENLPDSYLKIKIYRKHVLEGLSITDRSNEGLGRRIMDVLRMNYSEFLPITIYRAELPYYGIVGGNRMMYLDINAYTRMRCTLMDQNLNIIRTGVLNDSVQYIYFVCNNSVVRGIEVFDTIEIDFKNITDPPLLPIELIPETNIYENNVNRVRYRIINRMLYPIRVDAILVKLFNSTASFEILIRNTGMLEPGDLSRYVDLYIPGVPYDRYSLLLATIMEYDMAGQGSVLDRTYRSELPVQRIKYDSVNWLYLWKDPKTKYSISLRRPSTICGDENSDNGAIVFSINNNTQIRHVGNKYKCSCDFICYYFYDSSYSEYQDYGFQDGKNVLFYHLKPDLNRLGRQGADEPTFYEALKLRIYRIYGTEINRSVLDSPFSFSLSENISDSIERNVYIAEGFVNLLRGNVTNRLVYPIKLKYVEVFQEGIPVVTKRFERYILPNETFSFELDLLGTTLTSNELNINYVFEHSFAPGYFIRAIPKIESLCEGPFGSVSCFIDDPEFLRTYMRFRQNLSEWSIIGEMYAHKNYVFRTNLLIPKDYLLSLGIYTVGISALYVSSPSAPDGYPLDNNPARNMFRYYAGYLFNDQEIVISGRLDSPGADLYISLLFNFTKSLNITNLPNLQRLPAETRYYIFNGVLYSTLINRNPIDREMIILVRDRNTGFVFHSESVFVNRNSERITIVPLKNLSGNVIIGRCDSGIRNSLITHLGRVLACYGSEYMNITNIQIGHSSYVASISRNFHGRLVPADLDFNLSKLTWENNRSKIVIVPIYLNEQYMLAEILISNHLNTPLQLVTTRGEIYLGSTCGDIVKCMNSTHFRDPVVESYYILRDISHRRDWRMNSINVDASNPSYNPYFWPYESIVRGNYRYLQRFYLPYNVYRVYLPRASNIVVNGVNTNNLNDNLIYGGVNNIEYSSSSSNPYAELFILFSVPTTYQNFEVRNLSVSPTIYHYIGVPRVLRINFTINNYGSINEEVNIRSDLGINQNLSINQGTSTVFTLVLNATLGNYRYSLNISSRDGVFRFDIPIILNVSLDYINISAEANPRVFNITIPQNDSGILKIISNSSRPVFVTISVDSPGVDMERYTVTLSPNSSTNIRFYLDSLYILSSRNITFIISAENIAINQTIEVFINRPILNISGTYSAYLNNSVFNLTRPEIGLGRLTIVSNLTDVELFSVYSNNPAIIFNRSFIQLSPNTSGSIDFIVDSRFYDTNGTSNIYVISRSGNRTLPVQLYINLPYIYNISGTYSAYLNNSVFNLTRPEIGLGRLTIVSNLTDVELFSVYSDNPAIMFNVSYLILNPNTSGHINFIVDSRFYDSNGTSNIYVISRSGNRTLPVQLYLNFNSTYEIFVRVHDIYFNALILILDKNIVCIDESVNVQVLDRDMNYVDGAIVYYGSNSGIARHGKISISFSTPGIYSIIAEHQNYNRSRRLNVLVTECDSNLSSFREIEERIGRGELRNVTTKAQPNISINTTKFNPYSPKYFKNYTFIVPDRILVNSTGLIRVLDINGTPYRGYVYIKSPSGKIYRLITDELGYGMFMYEEDGIYEYYIIDDNELYPGPKTEAYYVSTYITPSIGINLGLLAVPTILILLARIALIDIRTYNENRLIFRVTNIIGSPLRRIRVYVNGTPYTTDEHGVITIYNPPKSVKIRANLYLTLGKNEAHL